MAAKPWKTWEKWGVAAVAVLLAFTLVNVAILLPVSSDYGFVCLDTGSRKGYHELFYGHRSSEWYQESRLEAFVKQRHPGELEHKWEQYHRSGWNIFGGGVAVASGRLPIMRLLFEDFNDYVDLLDDNGKKALYDVLRSGDMEKIRSEMGKARALLDEERKRRQAPPSD